MSGLLPILPPTPAPRHLVGGKGAQLLKLVELGALVPEFIVVPTTVAAWTATDGQFPKETWDAIAAQVRRWNTRWVSVRSSVTGEDGAEASFAGLFETFLYVTLDQLQQKILDCYQALSSERVRVYCREKNITEKLQMAVVIQRMLDPVASGVAFSRSPIAPTADVVIDASWGVGEGVVAGLVEVDHWRMSRLGEKLFESIAVKEHRLGPNDESGGTVGHAVAADKKDVPSLAPLELQAVCREVLRLEKALGIPVDVEFAFEERRLYLLQVRPITQQFPGIKCYADTNLAESYPGVTSPFTTSFVQLAYRNAFIESAVLLGARTDRLGQLLPHYQSLVGSVNHHLYYDLEHYYAVLMALPGGKKNIDNWHRMIGGRKEGMDVSVSIDTPSLREQVTAGLKLILFLCTQQRVLSRFAQTQEHQRQLIHQHLRESKSADETLRFLSELLKRPHGFGLTLINDLALMLGVKVLASVVTSVGQSEDILAPLLKTGDEVESLKPLRHLEDVVRRLPTEFWPELKLSLEAAPFWGDAYPEIWRELEQKGWKEEAALLAQFLALYGERSFEELKLESPTLRQSPRDFWRLLHFMRQHKARSTQKVVTPQSFDPKALPLLKRIVWKIGWAVTKRSIFWREKTRLLRGQFYNVIREVLERAAIELRRDYPAFQDFTWADYFSVPISVYERFANGELPNTDLAAAIREHRSWQETRGPFPEFLVIGAGEAPFAVPEITPSSESLTGQTAASGVVTGVPLVLDSPEEALEIDDLSDRILVTRHTDPAWVFIMSQCRGLISEKGSLLSHTAIIGRELGIPTIVGVKGAVNNLRSVRSITLDADRGLVSIHES